MSGEGILMGYKDAGDRSALTSVRSGSVVAGRVPSSMALVRLIRTGQKKTRRIIDSEQTRTDESLSVTQNIKGAHAKHEIKRKAKKEKRCKCKCVDPDCMARLWHMRGRRSQSLLTTSKFV